MTYKSFMKNTPGRRTVLLLFITALFITPFAGSSSTSQAAPGAPIPLVRIDLDDTHRAEALRDLGLYVHLQLPQPDGSLIVLLPADAEIQRELSQRGYRIQVIEPDSSAGNYYLLDTSVETLAQQLDNYPALMNIGELAVIHLDTAAARELASAGLRLRPLPLVPLAIPQQPDRIALPQSTEPNPLIQRMIDQVSQDTLYQYVGDLSGEWPVTVRGEPYQFFTRSTTEYQPITKATRFAYEHFSSLGILADYHYFTMYGLERRNVLAQQTGLEQPDRLFLLIAHLDSTSQSPDSEMTSIRC